MYKFFSSLHMTKLRTIKLATSKTRIRFIGVCDFHNLSTCLLIRHTGKQNLIGICKRLNPYRRVDLLNDQD